MNKKTRGYTMLNVCSAFLALFGGLYILFGLMAFANGSGGNPERFVESVMVAGFSFLGALLSFTFACLIHLAIDVADDLYMLRLLKVNEYRGKDQKPTPPPNPLT